jgi:hypothetical protein
VLTSFPVTVNLSMASVDAAAQPGWFKEKLIH